MKQLLQDISSGRAYLAEVAEPLCRDGCVLVRTHYSILAGPSERTLLEGGQGAILAKSRSEPPRVGQVLDELAAAGQAATVVEVFTRLGEQIPLGYCVSGTVVTVGKGVTDLAAGDRVVAVAAHAELVCVPRHLVAKVPDGLDLAAAAMAPAAALALHAIRLTEVRLGETVVVGGLDPIGMFAARLLMARGCRVMVVDASGQRRERALQLGAVGAFDSGSQAAAAVRAQTGGCGADAIIISPAGAGVDICSHSVRLCRRGAIVVMAGCATAGPFGGIYAGDLAVRAACGFGPGRADDAYEQLGHDYPYGLVRWTEHRNLQAALVAMAAGYIHIETITCRRLSPGQAATEYEDLSSVLAPAAAVVAFSEGLAAKTLPEIRQLPSAAIGDPVVSVIGAGEFARKTLIPLLSRTSARIAHIVDLDAKVARKVSRKYRASKGVTDAAAAIADPHVHAVFIATGHNAHGPLVREAIDGGKHVFVERPLAMDRRELDAIIDAANRHPDRQLLVGFNHRFSRAVARVRNLLADRGEPLTMNLTVNAGPLPPEHWLHDPVRGGGRIIGQAVAHLDLLTFIAGSRICSVSATPMGSGAPVRDDKAVFSLGFADGSVATLNFFANGPSNWPGEVLEIFTDGRVLKLEDCRDLTAIGFPGVKDSRARSSDWGFSAEITAFVNRIGAGGPPLIALDELVNTTAASFAASEAVAHGRTTAVPGR